MTYSKETGFSQFPSKFQTYEYWLPLIGHRNNKLKVFVYLLCFNKYGNIAYKSPSKISADIGLSKKKVCKALKELVELDVIRTVYESKTTEVLGYWLNPFCSIKVGRDESVGSMENRWIMGSLRAEKKKKSKDGGKK